MMITNPVSRDELRIARNVIFLDDLQNELRKKNVHGLRLHMETVVEGMNTSRYIVAKTSDGVEITTQRDGGKGQHGHYVHPRNGDPVSAAFHISHDWKDHCRAERAKADAGQ